MAKNNLINAPFPLSPANGGCGVANSYTLTINAASTINQDVSTTASPTFNNVNANNVSKGTTTVVAVGGTTTLTVNSTRVQVLTGSGGNQTFKLPDATTLSIGWTFEFNNNSTDNLNIVDNASGAVATVLPGAYCEVINSSISFPAGQWDHHWLMPSSAAYGSAGLSVTGTLSASGNVSFTNGTQYAPILGGGASNPISYATSGQSTSGYVLTSTGSSSSPTWQAVPSGTGNLVLISTQNASSSSTIDFANVFSSSYNVYVIYGYGIVLSGGSAQLQAIVGTGATPTWQTGGSAYNATWGYVSPGSQAVGAGFNTGAYIPMTNSAVSTNSSTQPILFNASVYQPSNTGFYPCISGDCVSISNGNKAPGRFGGEYLTAGAWTSVRFRPDSGTITSGTFSLYGVVGV